MRIVSIIIMPVLLLLEGCEGQPNHLLAPDGVPASSGLQTQRFNSSLQDTGDTDALVAIETCKSMFDRLCAAFEADEIAKLQKAHKPVCKSVNTVKKELDSVRRTIEKIRAAKAKGNPIEKKDKLTKEQEQLLDLLIDFDSAAADQHASVQLLRPCTALAKRIVEETLRKKPAVARRVTEHVMRLCPTIWLDFDGDGTIERDDENVQDLEEAQQKLEQLQELKSEGTDC